MKWLKSLLGLVPYILAVVLIILIRTYVVTPVRVDGTSMDPTLKNKDILLLKKYDRHYDRFDIVVLYYNNAKLVKRIIGLPGDHIKYEDSILYVNGKEVKESFLNTTTSDFDLKDLNFDRIPTGYYLVLGDNRNNSTDSRAIGLIGEKDIIGTTTFRIFPFKSFGSI